MEALILYLNSIHALSPNLVDRLTNDLKMKEVERKGYLLKAGQVCRNVYFIQQGLLRCFYHQGDHEICSWFMREGDVIISVESFFQQTKSYESIQALEDCVLYYIDYKDVQALYRDFSEFNYVGRVLTEKYYCLSEQRLYSMRMQRSQERYNFLLEHHPELVLRVPSKYIASYLGMSEETLSRSRSRK